MRVIDCDWNKRNGNGQTTCLLCKTLTWDSWCYDFELRILDEKLFNTILCGDCISKIKNELECKMASSEKTIEKQDELMPSHLTNEFIQGLDKYMTKQDIKHIAHKVNEIINYLQHISKEEE